MGRMADLLRLTRVNAEPEQKAEADIWYRADLDQVHCYSDDAVMCIGPGATHKYIRSTGWHNLPPTGAATTLVPILNQAYALPFVPGRTCTLTDMAVNIAELGLGNVRGGFYNADQQTGLPTSLISDFGTISTGLAGQKTWAALSVTLRPILYYAVVVQQAIVATYSSRTSSDPIISEAAGAGPNFAANQNSYTATGITGALPATFGTPAGTAAAPSVVLKLT